MSLFSKLTKIHALDQYTNYILSRGLELTKPRKKNFFKLFKQVLRKKKQGNFPNKQLPTTKRLIYIRFTERYGVSNHIRITHRSTWNEFTSFL